MVTDMQFRNHRRKVGFTVPIRIEKTDRPINIAQMLVHIGQEVANSVVTQWDSHRAGYDVELTVTMEERP